MSTAIAVRDLCKTFGSGAGAARAVDHVTLDIQPGELFFLLGPSGCGKTTLLRMIAGFIDPTAGALLFDGSDITHVAPNKRNTGMVFQSYALWPHMTVEANVAFGLTIRRVGAEERSTRVREALDAVQMSGFEARKPNQLSGGQQQRVALARALVIRPDVLLLDEPLSNLDAKLRIELRSEIRRICKDSGITTVYVTHDQKEALSMADRVAILKAGNVIQVGTPRALYEQPASRFVAEFLGETNFIPICGANPGPAGSVVETRAGTLEARPLPSEKGDFVCSIRPEALSLKEDTDGHNTLAGTVVESTYLGELAQHIVELKDGTRVKVAQLHPAGRTEPGGVVGLAVRPDDVIILSA